MILQRRKFLSFLAAPAIVYVGNLMPISVQRPQWTFSEITNYRYTLAEYRILFKPLLADYEHVHKQYLDLIHAA